VGVGEKQVNAIKLSPIHFRGSGEIQHGVKINWWFGAVPLAD
jgi:hypothetical protein